jgi:hypothetical protein
MGLVVPEISQSGLPVIFDHRDLFWIREKVLFTTDRSQQDATLCLIDNQLFKKPASGKLSGFDTPGVTFPDNPLITETSLRSTNNLSM